MAEIMAEYIYYERFCAHIKSKMSFDAVFAVAARLRQTLSRRERLDYFFIVEKETVEYFISSESVVVKDTSRSAVQGEFSSRLPPYDIPSWKLRLVVIIQDDAAAFLATKPRLGMQVEIC